MTPVVPMTVRDELDPSVCQVCFRESCEEHLATKPARGLRAVRALDLVDAPPPVAIIDGLAYEGCITLFVAESGAGKTFALLGAAAAVSDGRCWHGRETIQGAVAYIAYEGDALGVRLRALREIQGHELAQLFIVRARDPISPPSSREQVELASAGEVSVLEVLERLTQELAAHRPPIALRLVIIDTARASMTGNEDASDHVAAYLRAVRRIMATVPGAAVVIAHHAGWQDGDTRKRRERGSSAWRGNCDAVLYLEAGDYTEATGDTTITLTALKLRDAERPAPLRLVRRRVTLNERDARGRLVTTCLIDVDERSHHEIAQADAAVAEAETRALDLQLLRLVQTRPEFATSRKQLASGLSVRLQVVDLAVRRLVKAGWLAEPERQRMPYRLTLQGQAELSEGKPGE